jgi:hypothetical protein
MKSTELLLLESILTDVGIMCNTSVDRDIEVLISRVEHEGPSFMTITLPNFGKAFFRCLELGYCDPSLFPGFSFCPGSSARIPKFLQGILSQVFDVTGALRGKPSVEAIDGVRQICLTFNKTKQECTDERKVNALNSYLACEGDLRSFRYNSWRYCDDFRRITRLVFGRLFDDLERKLLAGELMPKHGPGAVAERIVGNGKYRSRQWTRRLERAMPADNYLFCNAEHVLSSGMDLDLLRAEDEQPVRVIFVPKTQKTPRVIAIEPIHMQYTQQAFMGSLVSAIESDRLVGCSIHFTDATINGKLALEASVTQKLATLDLSEASDRVHASLVYNMMRDFPHLARAVFACRSKYAVLPNGSPKVPLVKFASMGSALCFPMEAMVFYTICLLGVLKARNLPVTYKSIISVRDDIHVFGDDLIIPADACSLVIELLESAKLKVNQGKTFVFGKFRESCGVDAYDGHIVTPVYVRNAAPRDKSDTSALVSYVATSNLFYKKGYWRTATYMREVLLSRVGSLPHVLETSALVGYYSFLGTYSVERWNNVSQCFETRGLTAKVKKISDPLEEYNRLLKFFLHSNKGKQMELFPSVYEPLTDEETFSKSVVRGSLYTKSRWAQPL